MNNIVMLFSTKNWRPENSENWIERLATYTYRVVLHRLFITEVWGNLLVETAFPFPRRGWWQRRTELNSCTLLVSLSCLRPHFFPSSRSSLCAFPKPPILLPHQSYSSSSVNQSLSSLHLPFSPSSLLPGHSSRFPDFGPSLPSRSSFFNGSGGAACVIGGQRKTRVTEKLSLERVILS